MNTYDFTTKDGKYQLDFPSDAMAIQHGKFNQCLSVSFFDTKLAGVEDIGYGFMAFKITPEGKARLNTQNQCEDCG